MQANAPIKSLRRPRHSLAAFGQYGLTTLWDLAISRLAGLALALAAICLPTGQTLAERSTLTAVFGNQTFQDGAAL